MIPDPREETINNPAYIIVPQKGGTAKKKKTIEHGHREKEKRDSRPGENFFSEKSPARSR